MTAQFYNEQDVKYFNKNLKTRYITIPFSLGLASYAFKSHYYSDGTTKITLLYSFLTQHKKSGHRDDNIHMKSILAGVNDEEYLSRSTRYQLAKILDDFPDVKDTYKTPANLYRYLFLLHQRQVFFDVAFRINAGIFRINAEIFRINAGMSSNLLSTMCITPMRPGVCRSCFCYPNIIRIPLSVLRSSGIVDFLHIAGKPIHKKHIVNDCLYYIFMLVAYKKPTAEANSQAPFAKPVGMFVLTESADQLYRKIKNLKKFINNWAQLYSIAKMTDMSLYNSTVIDKQFKGDYTSFTVKPLLELGTLCGLSAYLEFSHDSRIVEAWLPMLTEHSPWLKSFKLTGLQSPLWTSDREAPGPKIDGSKVYKDMLIAISRAIKIGLRDQHFYSLYLDDGGRPFDIEKVIKTEPYSELIQ